MWKNSKNRDRQSESDPTLIESTPDEHTQQSTTCINSGSFSLSSRPAFGRKRTEDVLKGLPALPLCVLCSIRNAIDADTESNKLQVSGITNGRPMSEARTVSSVYSQPSPELNDDPIRKNGHKIRSSSLYPDDVSPLGSPNVKDGDNGQSSKSSPDVSPVSDSPTPLANRSPVLTPGRFNSNIPVAKKTRKFWNRPSTDSPERGSILTHWDVYSGEPTTREKGKPPQITPSTVKMNVEPSPGKLNGNPEIFGTSTHISGGTTTGRKRLANRDLNMAPIVRPEWRGASGRHKIVNPLLDKPLPPGKSLTFPAGSDKQQQDSKLHDKIVESSIISSPPHRSLNQPSQPSIILNDKELSHAAPFPDPMAEASSNSTVSPPFQQRTRSPNPILSIDDARSPLARNPSNEEFQDPSSEMLPKVQHDIVKETYSPLPQQTPERRSQTISDPMLNNRDTRRDSSHIGSTLYSDLQHMDLQDQPSSHFGSESYAGTTYVSPATTPEVGSNSPAVSSMYATPNSILNRKRPVPPAGSFNLKITARKPTPSELGKPKQTPEGRRKSLPKSPPEVEATSRISCLQARLDDLHQRRRNLQTVIHELTNVVQPSSIAYDMASRQEIKKTVEGLGRELAEVIRDEHDTGLKLHRALKRDDEFAAYEPTSIWVRRVTS